MLIPAAFFVFWFGSNVTGSLQNAYEADLYYSLLAPGRGPIGITEAQVANFRKITLTSLAPLRRVFAFPEFYNVQANITVYCDGSYVFNYLDSFRMTSYGGLERVVTLRNLPPGSSCKVDIDVICEPFDSVYCSKGIEQTLWNVVVP